MRFEATRLDLHTLVDHNALTRLDLVVDVVDHLPISRSCSCSTPPVQQFSSTSVVGHTYGWWRTSTPRSSEVVDVVDPRELQQHDGVVVEKEEERLEAPRVMQP